MCMVTSRGHYPYSTGGVVCIYSIKIVHVMHFNITLCTVTCDLCPYSLAICGKNMKGSLRM